MITNEDLFEFLLDRAIEIWQNRANGIEDIRGCPLCIYAELIEEKDSSGSMCEKCILRNCYETPYGRYSNLEFEDGKDVIDNRLDASKDMVIMLQSYKDHDMDTFEEYLGYWDTETDVMTSYWKDKKHVS